MINKDFIKETKKSDWGFGNNILYKMCRENFKHEETDKIIGKVILIGRAYAAAIERRKNKAEDNDVFYVEKVAPKFRNSKLDNLLRELKKEKEITENNIPKILNVHFYLTALIKELTKQDKRSFSSKYLHFHLPHLFFIYDTRAVKAIGKLNVKYQYQYRDEINSNMVDKDYASFYYKCFAQKNKFEAAFKMKITARHFDTILMKIVELEGN